MKTLAKIFGIVLAVGLVSACTDQAAIKQSTEKAQASAQAAATAAQNAESAANGAQAAASKANDAANAAQADVGRANDAVARLDAAFATSVTK